MNTSMSYSCQLSQKNTDCLFSKARDFAENDRGWDEES